MKLTVLGKYGPFPKAGEGAASGYLFEENGVKIAMDMGAGVLARLMAATDMSTLDAVYISHLHYDHTSDLLPLRYLLDSLNKKLTVITQKEDSEWYRILFGSPRFEVININESSVLSIKGLTLTFAEMEHPARDFAIKIQSGGKSFVYTGDTVMTPALLTFTKGADMVLSDCTKPETFRGPHMTTADADKLQKNAGGKLIASHFAPSDEPAAALTHNQSILPAEEGKTYEI